VVQTQCYLFFQNLRTLNITNQAQYSTSKCTVKKTNLLSFNSEKKIKPYVYIEVNSQYLPIDPNKATIIPKGSKKSEEVQRPMQDLKKDLIVHK